MLSRALQDANRTIELQASQILQQSEYISQLERQLAALISSSPPVPTLSPPCCSSSPPSSSGPSSGSLTCVNRKKTRLQEAIQRTKEINDEPLSGDNLDQLLETSTASPSVSLSPVPAVSSTPQEQKQGQGWGAETKRFPVPSLYIAHDNPQLGKIICDSFTADSREQQGMAVMIETKDLDGSLHILLGTLIYSDLSLQISPSVPSPPPASQSRGEQCLVCVNMTGFIFSLAAVERKILQKTTDILLSPATIHNSAKIEDEHQLREFFNRCTARVDIILSPFHDRSLILINK